MQLVLLTALGVGGATVFGTLLGFVFKKASHKFSDIVLAFAAGVMLAAAVLGLILPSLDYGGKWSLLITVAGVFAGAICVNLFDRLVPHLHRLSGADQEAHPEQTAQLNKVLLFVTAIAIHNMPEGIAAGFSFGTGSNKQALLIAGSIALQNIPEGMVIIAPLLSIGIRENQTFLLAFMTGVIEIIGTLLGYIAVSAAAAILPFALAFAGGTMLYVIFNEIIPDTHKIGKNASYSLLTGFCVMLLLDALLP
jgi:ZIP family zinc transporter